MPNQCESSTMDMCYHVVCLYCGIVNEVVLHLSRDPIRESMLNTFNCYGCKRKDIPFSYREDIGISHVYFDKCHESLGSAYFVEVPDFCGTPNYGVLHIKCSFRLDPDELRLEAPDQGKCVVCFKFPCSSYALPAPINLINVLWDYFKSGSIKVGSECSVLKEVGVNILNSGVAFDDFGVFLLDKGIVKHEGDSKLADTVITKF